MPFQPIKQSTKNHPSIKTSLTLTGETAALVERILPMLEQCVTSGHYSLFAGILNGEDIDILGINQEFPVEDTNRMLVKLEETLTDHAIQVLSPPKEKTPLNHLD